MIPAIVTPPTGYPVTLEEVKTHCRVDGTADDTYLTGLIAAATTHVQRHTGRSILEQTLRATFGGFSNAIELPYGPVRSVTTVAYYDAAGADQTLATGWALDNSVYPSRIVKNADADWPETQARFDAVRITYVAGYEDGDENLDPIRHAMLLLIGHWYENREAVGERMSELPLAFEALLGNYRTFRF